MRLKREYTILFCSTALSVIAAVLILRIFEPRLFNKPVDFKVYKSEERLIPFFSLINDEYKKSHQGAIIPDPLLGVRGVPFWPESSKLGPHDAFGLRNNKVPQQADLVFLGDSQIYGINASLEGNMVSQIARKLSSTVYNISLGGWSSAQHLELLPLTFALRPKLVVFTVYTGNDAIEAFRVVYGEEAFSKFKRNAELSIKDMPVFKYPAPVSEQFHADISPHKIEMTFTPKLRMVSNDIESKVVDEGYKVISKALQFMLAEASSRKTKAVVLLLPTKELVYQPWVNSGSSDYLELVKAEAIRREMLISDLQSAVKDFIYYDSLPVLRKAVEKGYLIYPPDHDGHPLPLGYAVLGAWLSEQLSSLLNS